MKRTYFPGITDIVVVTDAAEIRTISNDSRFDRDFIRHGPVRNVQLLRKMLGIFSFNGRLIAPLLPRTDPSRAAAQDAKVGACAIGRRVDACLRYAMTACFESAIALAACERKIALPADVTIYADVDLNLGEGGYFLTARLNVSLPGVERHVAQTLVDDAYEICPYSKAARGNIEVSIDLV